MIGVIGVFGVLLAWRFVLLWAAAVYEAVGVSPPTSRFEARSALTGAGYTTSQSEQIVEHPAARRAASTLMLIGYWGPATILALLGTSFVVPPDGEGLRSRALTLAVLTVSLLVLDRVGVIRTVGSRPAVALARRMTRSCVFEMWTVISDRAIASLTVPDDHTRADSALDALDTAEVTLLAVTPTGQRDHLDPAGSAHQDGPGPGDHVVVFGSREALEALRVSLASRGGPVT